MRVTCKACGDYHVVILSHRYLLGKALVFVTLTRVLDRVVPVIGSVTTALELLGRGSAMSEHAPAPWRATESTDGEPYDLYDICDANYELIATVHAFESHADKTEAAIQSVPKILETPKTVERWLDLAHHPALSKVRETIADAERLQVVL